MINSNLSTNKPVKQTGLSTADAINNYLNTVSNDMDDNTHYIRQVVFAVNTDSFSAGTYLLEGNKVTSNSEWQKLTKYSGITGVSEPIKYERSKINGAWQDWATTRLADYHEIQNLALGANSEIAVTLTLNKHYLVMAKNAYNFGGLYLIECGGNASTCKITAIKEAGYLTLTATGKNTFTAKSADAGYYINAHRLDA